MDSIRNFVGGAVVIVVGLLIQIVIYLLPWYALLTIFTLIWVWCEPAEGRSRANDKDGKARRASSGAGCSWSGDSSEGDSSDGDYGSGDSGGGDCGGGCGGGCGSCGGCGG